MNPLDHLTLIISEYLVAPKHTHIQVEQLLKAIRAQQTQPQPEKNDVGK